MDAPQDIRLLLAILTPLLGAGLVMATGKRPNVREACSFVAALVLFIITASLVPAVHAGRMLRFTVFELLPGLSISLRADALSMIFAVAASFLWIVTVFYSAGYITTLARVSIRRTWSQSTTRPARTASESPVNSATPWGSGCPGSSRPE